MPKRRNPEVNVLVDADWVQSPAARRILVHWADSRPAWLWSADGSRLLWRNPAAPWFNAKLKKSGARLAPEPVPIKGQVARLLRLGLPGRSSLSRVQVLAGDKPGSTTCTVTPLELPDGGMALLMVGVDPIEPDFAALRWTDVSPLAESLFPPDTPYLLLDPDGRAVVGSEGALERFAPLLAGAPASLELDGRPVTPVRLKASPQGHQLVLLEGARHAIEEVRAAEGIARDADPVTAPEPDAPPLPFEPSPPIAPPAAEATEPADAVPEADEPPRALSSLFDRLADTESLYGELTEADETFPGRADEPPAAQSPPAAVSAETPPQHPEPDVIAAVIAYADDLDAETGPTTYRVTGRGFTPLAQPAAPEAEPPPVPDEPQTPVPDEPQAPDTAAIERTSRYNFDELSRILTDRVGADPADRPSAPAGLDTPIEPPRAVPSAGAEGALINIAAETFVLNRLPLGIMVFREQQVLFANRALTDLVGYESVDRLRAAGLPAIFPGDDAGAAGPVTHLVRRDGTPMPVTARLQSITWQGRPALMLSASAADIHPGHEAAVRGFAELLSSLTDEGFVSLDRAGLISHASPRARLALARAEDDLAGTTLAGLIHPADLPALRDFLERPARFAETSRPSVELRVSNGPARILLFAEGQAGVVRGYFGFVRLPPPPAKPAAEDEDDVDPSMLVRVSRGVRRPLNTIIGFADLIRSAAFGTADNHRYLEYARDIKTAGQEIAVLVDELEDYARLKAGKYAARPAELDLAALLESSMLRVRGQASAARVLVRSAISERLPRIRADRASLGQAILNLLASAIDQTPPGGQVILSAQPGEHGGIVVNVRDSGAATADPGERFVVFRDGLGKDGEPLTPVRSSVGLALTRSLVAVNACTLSVDPAGAVGTLFSISIPADLVAAAS